MSSNNQLPPNNNDDSNKNNNLLQENSNNTLLEEDLFDEILFFNVKELLGNNKINPSLSKYLSTNPDDTNLNTSFPQSNTIFQNNLVSTLTLPENSEVTSSNLPLVENDAQLGYNVGKPSSELPFSYHHNSMFDPFYYIDSSTLLDPIIPEQSESILQFDHLKSQPFEASSVSSSTTSTTTLTSNHISLTSSSGSSNLPSANRKKRLKSDLTTSSSTLSYLQLIDPKDRVHTPTIRKEGKYFDFRKKCIYCRLYKTKFYCIDCNVPLCLDGIEHNNCWYNYHLNLQQSKK